MGSTPGIVDNSNATAITIDSSENVGIGATTPAAAYGTDTVLEIKGDTSPGLVINDTGQGSKYGIHADSDDLKITYGANVLATFQQNGNVGIGTTSPNSYSGYTALTLNHATNGGLLDFERNGTLQGEIYANSANLGLGLQAVGNRSIELQTNGTIRATMDGSGNFGIGTGLTSPQSKLHVVDETDISASGGGAGQFQVVGNGYATSIAMDATRSHIYHNSTGRNLSFGTNESIDMTIKGNNGNVGIGTESPSEKLHVYTGAAGVAARIETSAGQYTYQGSDAIGTYIEQVGTTAATRKFRLQSSNGSSAYTQLFIDGANQRVEIIPALDVHQGAVWSETAQGTGKGTIHLDPAITTDHAGTSITFGASDTGSGQNAQAGIYTRTDGSYGSKIYLATTDSYTAGSKTALSINHSGHVDLPRGYITSQVPAFNAYHNANAYVPATSTVFAHNTVRYNNGGHFSTSTYRFTAPVAGLYHFNFHTIYYGNGTNAHLSLRKNGSGVDGTNTHFSNDQGAVWQSVNIESNLDLAQNDYVDVFSNTMGGMTYLHGTTWNEFSGYLVG